MKQNENENEKRFSAEDLRAQLLVMQMFLDKALGAKSKKEQRRLNQLLEELGQYIVVEALTYKPEGYEEIIKSKEMKAWIVSGNEISRFACCSRLLLEECVKGSTVSEFKSSISKISDLFAEKIDEEKFLSECVSKVFQLRSKISISADAAWAWIGVLKNNKTKTEWLDFLKAEIPVKKIVQSGIFITNDCSFVIFLIKSGVSLEVTKELLDKHVNDTSTLIDTCVEMERLDILNYLVESRNAALKPLMLCEDISKMNGWNRDSYLIRKYHAWMVVDGAEWAPELKESFKKSLFGLVSVDSIIADVGAINVLVKGRPAHSNFLIVANDLERFGLMKHGSGIKEVSVKNKAL